MLLDRYEPEDVFARVPQAASRLDPVLKAQGGLLEVTGSTVPRASRLWQTASLYAGAWVALDPGRSPAAHADL